MFNKPKISKETEQEILEACNAVFDGCYTKVLKEKNGQYYVKNTKGPTLTVSVKDFE